MMRICSIWSAAVSSTGSAHSRASPPRREGRAYRRADLGQGASRPRRALKFVLTWLERHEAGLEVVAVGHRVVLGGAAHERPTLVDERCSQSSSNSCRSCRHTSHSSWTASGWWQSISQAPAGSGVRHVVSSDMPQTAQRYALPAAVLGDEIRHSGVSRNFLRLHLSRAAALRPQGTTGDCGASRWRRQHVRHARRQKRRYLDGLQRHRRIADGDALRRARSAYPVVSAEIEAMQRSELEIFSTRSQGCSDFRDQRRHAGAESQQAPAAAAASTSRLSIVRRLCSGAGRSRCFGIHRRHRRK